MASDFRLVVAISNGAGDTCLIIGGWLELALADCDGFNLCWADILICGVGSGDSGAGFRVNDECSGARGYRGEAYSALLAGLGSDFEGFIGVYDGVSGS